MKSPFPGMDPYLERHWRSVHARLIVYSADMLQRQLPKGLIARIEERVYIESPAGRERDLIPDVYLIEESRRVGRRTKAAKGLGNGHVALAEPLLVDLGDVEITERFISIRDARDDERVVTTIEFVSPTNKVAGPGQDAYLKKQDACIAAKVNLVEIDLVRTGQHVVAVPASYVPAEKASAYLICVRRAATPRQAQVYPVSLRSRLPAFAIPLRPNDREPVLDLQLLINRIYVEGRHDSIDYTKDPEPPLDPDDAKWADALLRRKKRR
jgi:hypothetical protein